MATKAQRSEWCIAVLHAAKQKADWQEPYYAALDFASNQMFYRAPRDNHTLSHCEDLCRVIAAQLDGAPEEPR